MSIQNSTIFSSIVTSRAVSLVETIIAFTLLAILSGITVQALDQITKAGKKMEMQEYVAEEGWRVLEDLGEMIQASAIDYEEYYSRNVYQPQNAFPSPYSFGENYGQYHKQFFNPVNEYETGTNPYQGSEYTADEANAFCPSTGTPNPTCSQTSTFHTMDELFLIDTTGTQRTYFIIEDNALARAELFGSDTDEDGLIDIWAPIPADFVRLTPLNFSIDSLTFFISPLEDPFKGFNETGSVFESVQQQPKVTIVLNAHYQLFDANGDPIPLTAVNQYIGPAASVRLQTTVSTGVSHILPTYEP